MKRVVYYRELYEEPVIGKSAMCFPIDHPEKEISNARPVITSRVIAVRGDEFETVFTIYRRRILND